MTETATRPKAPPRQAASQPVAKIELKTGFPPLFTASKSGYRILVHAVGGWGKTTLAVYADNPILFMSRGETGYDTLLKSGCAPQIPAIEILEYKDFRGWVDGLASKEDFTKGVLAVDTLGGMAQLCYEHIVQRDFGGDFGKDKGGDFRRSMPLVSHEWSFVLKALDAIRARGVHILLLAHTVVQTFSMSTGVDHQYYGGSCYPKIWELTSNWTDLCLFGHYVAQITSKESKIDPNAMPQRVLRVNHSDGYIAKNRTHLTESIMIPNDPKLGWKTIMEHLN